MQVVSWLGQNRRSMNAHRPDHYPHFHALSQGEVEGLDYTVSWQQRNTALAIIAPHGGMIETATSAIALAIAGEDLSCYCFNGIKPGNNQCLHITSTRFDEPRCEALLQGVATVLTVHGERSTEDRVFLGGLDQALGAQLQHALQASGFAVAPHHNPRLQGRHPRNLCNRGSSGRGVQLELSRGLRSSLFLDHNSSGSLQGTPRLALFAQAVRQGIHRHQGAMALA